MTNPLTDIIPAPHRKRTYALLALAALGLAAYKASEGDWIEFTGLLLGSLGFGTAGSNVGDDSGDDDIKPFNSIGNVR